MKKYEYKVVFGINGSMPEQNEELNTIGEEGWELVSVIRGTFFGIDMHREHTFKREKLES